METTENIHERNHCCGRHRPRIGWIILGIFGFIAFAALFGAVVMWLWNCLMPVIFHLGVITYWQAVGLAILGRLLFGGMHHGGHHKPHGFGPWNHRRRFRDGKNRDCSNGTKWSYYDKFWDEEGEHAFNDYLKRKTEDNPRQEK